MILSYNTLLVMTGTSLLGAAAGMIGIFLLLRKRSLLSDGVSHATLPGIALGFLCALSLGLDDGRHLPTLLCGAALSGILGAFCVQLLKDHTRLNEDTATGVILSAFFGAGIVLLSYIQTLGSGSRAGLDSFLLGQTAALTLFEIKITAFLALIAIAASIVLRKELILLCFDEIFTSAQGYSRRILDSILMALMLLVVCIGLKTVGLILIISLLIIPAATARLLSDKLSTIMIIAPFCGAISAATGSYISALITNIPTGAMIVLICSLFFTLALLFSSSHGLWRCRKVLT
ncbi:MAG: metal ABC transporter permease [Micavibrio sp.]